MLLAKPVAEMKNFSYFS